MTQEKNTASKDVKDMSNQELDKLYASLANGCSDGTPSDYMKSIVTEMESRYDKFHSQSK